MNAHRGWKVQSERLCTEIAQGFRSRKYRFYFEQCLEHAALFVKTARCEREDCLLCGVFEEFLIRESD